MRRVIANRNIKLMKYGRMKRLSGGVGSCEQTHTDSVSLKTVELNHKQSICDGLTGAWLNMLNEN